MLRACAGGHTDPGPRPGPGAGVLRGPARARAGRGAAGRAALPLRRGRVRAVRVRGRGLRRPHADGLRRRRHRGRRGRPPAPRARVRGRPTCPEWRSATGSPRCPATTRAGRKGERAVWFRDCDGNLMGSGRRCAYPGRRLSRRRSRRSPRGPRRGAGRPGRACPRARASAARRARRRRAPRAARPSGARLVVGDRARRSPTTVSCRAPRRAAAAPSARRPGGPPRGRSRSGEEEPHAGWPPSRSRSWTVRGPSASVARRRTGGCRPGTVPWAATWARPAPPRAAATFSASRRRPYEHRRAPG